MVSICLSDNTWNKSSISSEKEKGDQLIFNSLHTRLSCSSEFQIDILTSALLFFYWTVLDNRILAIVSSEHENNNILDLRTSNAILDRSYNFMYLPLKKKQKRLAKDNPGVLAAVAKGLKMAINECQYQFKDRRWDCPTTDFPRGRSIFGKIVQKGECCKRLVQKQ